MVTAVNLTGHGRSLYQEVRVYFLLKNREKSLHGKKLLLRFGEKIVAFLFFFLSSFFAYVLEILTSPLALNN